MPRVSRCVLSLAVFSAAIPCSSLARPCFPAGHAEQQPLPSSEEMDKLTAPIALYPDALLAQILECSQSPYQVKQVDSWIKAHSNLKGTDAQAAAQKEGFDLCFVALVPFPQVMDMMATQPDWTTKLGHAFTTNKDAVFDSIQRLRAKAKAAGNLQTTKQQEVVVQQAPSGQQVIVIQPANPEIVYVPVYTTTVYTQPAATSGQVAGAAVIGFTAGVIVGAAIANNNNYYGWGYHGGCCYAGGWNNYANYHSDMATQRQNSVSSNQANRQSTVSSNQANRQSTATSSQESRQAQQSSNQASRQSQQDQGQAARSENQSSRQSAAQSNQSATQGSRQSNAQGGASSRSGGMGAYQSGNQARSASSRGQSSMSSRFSGGGRTGGGRR